MEITVFVRFVLVSWNLVIYMTWIKSLIVFILTCSPLQHFLFESLRFSWFCFEVPQTFSFHFEPESFLLQNLFRYTGLLRLPDVLEALKRQLCKWVNWHSNVTMWKYQKGVHKTNISSLQIKEKGTNKIMFKLVKQPTNMMEESNEETKLWNRKMGLFKLFQFWKLTWQKLSQISKNSFGWISSMFFPLCENLKKHIVDLNFLLQSSIWENVYVVLSNNDKQNA